METLRAAHESWNRRDFEAAFSRTAENFTYSDHGRNIALNGRAKYREWSEAWAKAFSDGRITNPVYIDGGDVVVAQFTAVGTNDGPMGSMKPTGRKLSLPFCEIYRFDKEGRMIAGTCYYDQYTLLTQLGHLQPLAAAA
jgi:steroid delta-isomerase-like uncharacterized protein